MPLKDYQFVRWFPIWHGFDFIRIDPERTSLALIYEWSLGLGFWEIRKWKTSSGQQKEEQGMIFLTEQEILMLLKIIKEKLDIGYVGHSEGQKAKALQAKLSIMLEIQRGKKK